VHVDINSELFLEGVLGPGLDPLGNRGNRTDPGVQVLQVRSCVQNLVVAGHPVDEVHELLEVQLSPGERVPHKELPIVPIEVGFQLEQSLGHGLLEDLLQGGVPAGRVFGVMRGVLQRREDKFYLMRAGFLQLHSACR